MNGLRDMLDFACSTESFSLTLTLSLREKEQQASDWCLADGRPANSGGTDLEAMDHSPSPKGRVPG
jgi:hypothetical protein